MAEDQLADPRAFGDTPDLGDIGVQPGLPFQGRTGRAVPLEIVKVGDLVNEDVRPLCEGDQVIVDGGVTGEHDGAVRGVETVRQRRNRVAVRHGHGGDPDGSVVDDGHRNLGDASPPGRDADVGGPDETARVRHGGVERHDVQMVGIPGQDAVDQVRRPGERPFRVDHRPALEGGRTGGRRFGARRPVHADRRERAVLACADAPWVKEHAGQVTNVVRMKMGQEHRCQTGEVESRGGESRRRPATAVDDEDALADDERRRDPAAPRHGIGRAGRAEQDQLGGHQCAASSWKAAPVPAP